MASKKPGVIIAGEWRYRLTKTDTLWAARMVDGETIAGRARRTEDARAVLWTMTALFSPDGQRAKYGRRRFATFTDQIRAYSQPINPRWLAGGDFCRADGLHHGSDACAEARLRARERLQRMPWGEIDAEMRRVVVEWATGKGSNPVPGAIEFAADRVAQSFIGRTPGARQVARVQNTFIAGTAAPLPDIRASTARSTPAVAVLITASAGALLTLTWAQRAQAR